MWAIMRSSPRVCVPANAVSDLIFLLGACMIEKMLRLALLKLATDLNQL